MNLTHTLRLSGLGLILVAMTGCSLFRSTPTPPAVTDNGPLAPAISSTANAGDTFAQGSAPVYCTTAQVARLAAGNPALANAVATNVFYFSTDSNVLSKEAVANLTEQAKLLNIVPGLKLQIEGHTDERGTDNYNMGLGERRANAAASLLGNSGAKDSQISVVSYGKTKPAVDGHDEAAWSKNRRIVLDYTGACL